MWHVKILLGLPGGSVVKNPPVKQETQVLSLSWEDPLDKKWQPTPIFLPGESHGHRSLVGYSPWGHKRVRYDWVIKTTTTKILQRPILGANVNKGACKFKFNSVQFSSVQYSRSVVSDSLRPHESQHARPPCPSPTPGVHSNSRPSSRWCHPAILSSVIPFSSCP